MDIGSKSGYPSSALSNFAGHRFTLDGVEIWSMEGFLQSLKFKEKHIQVEVCKLIGAKAKFRGKPKKWFRDQILWWRGQDMRRDSIEYQSLLDRAYMAMYNDSEGFRNALHATQKATLTHSMGKNKINETVLTEREFCSRLMKLRDNNGVL